MKLSLAELTIGIFLMASVVGCVSQREGARDSATPEVVDISIRTATVGNPQYIGWPKYFDYAPSKAQSQEAMLNTPEFASGKPWFESMLLGTDQANPFTFAVDIPPDVESSRQASLYFDADNNGVFDNGEQYGLSPTSMLGNALAFEPIAATVSIDGAAVARHLVFAIYLQPRTVFRLQLFISDYVEATLRTAQESYPIRIIDQNKNGLFSDTASGMTEQGDHVLIDLERDGFQGSLGPNGDIWSLGDNFFFNGMGIRLIPEHNGSTLRIQSEILEAKPVRFSLPEFQLTLVDSSRFYTVRGKSGIATVPRGTYQLRSCIAESTDGKGDRWHVQWFNGTEPLMVNTHRRHLEFGPPFRARVERTAFNDAIGLGVVITGRSGEEYSLEGFRKNGSIVTPYVRVVDDKGVTLAEGPSYLHGEDYWRTSFEWHPGDISPGEYTAIPLVNYGPFDVRAEPFKFQLGEARNINQ